MRLDYKDKDLLGIAKETLKYAIQCEICGKDKNGDDIDLCVFCNKACCYDCMNNGICVKCRVEV